MKILADFQDGSAPFVMADSRDLADETTRRDFFRDLREIVIQDLFPPLESASFNELTEPPER